MLLYIRCNIFTYQNLNFSYKYASPLVLKNHKKKHKKHKTDLKITSSGNIYEFKSWMYAHKYYTQMMTNEFLNKVYILMYQARNTLLMQETDKMLCPCCKCKNTKFSRSSLLVVKQFENI